MLRSQVKFSADRQIDGQPERRTDRRTPVEQYAPDLSMRGHKKKSHFKSLKLIYWTFSAG